MEETKGLKEEDHKSSIRKLDKAEKDAADAKRLLHEQSTLKSLQSKGGKTERYQFYHLKIYVYDMPEFYKEQAKINPDCRHDYSHNMANKIYTGGILA